MTLVHGIGSYVTAAILQSIVNTTHGMWDVLKNGGKHAYCLEGMRCTNPECDSPLGSFEIHLESWFTVFDDGTDSYSDVEWDEVSETICCNCHTQATVGELRGEKREENEAKYFVLSSSCEGVVCITEYTKAGLEKAMNAAGAEWPDQERLIDKLVFNNVTEWDRKKNYMIIRGEIVAPAVGDTRELP